MNKLIMYILSILELILGITYIFILKGYLPSSLSIIYTIISLVYFIYLCKDNMQKKIYNIRNFFILVFLNILLLPYVSNLKICYLILIVTFVIGLLLTVIMIITDKKIVKKSNEIFKYICFTLGICLLFFTLRIIIPYLHKSNILFIVWISIYIFLIIMIRKKK